MAVFRNEGHILEEWLEHHIKQGVDKFYLTNNASEDNYYQILEKYKNRVKLLHDRRVLNQTQLTDTGIQLMSYRQMLKYVTTDWLIICDLDEFFYTTNGLSIKDYIDRLEQENISQMLITLKNFPSNGHITQPDKVLPNFTMRNKVYSKTNSIHKALVKTADIEKMYFTHCKLKSGCVTTNPTFQYRDDFFTHDDVINVNKPEIQKYRSITEEILAKHGIYGNHYVNQSYDWFFKVKATRGIAGYPNKRHGDTVDAFWKSRWDMFEKRKSIHDDQILKCNITL